MVALAVSCNPGIPTEKQEQLMIAAEMTCELCREYLPATHLEIHAIGSHSSRRNQRDPSAGILVVCVDCHTHIHSLPVPAAKLRAVIRSRSFYIRRDMRKVLGYRPRPYIPPDGTDPAVVYDEYMGRTPPGHCRLSG